MKSHLVCYASARFLPSQQRLIESALRYGVDEVRAWNRAMLEETTFYKMHKGILDLPRGGGYWLWKPFIIEEALKKIRTDDVIVYLDAGVEITGKLSPLLCLCLERSGIMVFAGHYDDVGVPNLCRTWTKRDCFVGMDCDEARYHEGQMLDASLIVLARTERSLAFIHEWGLYCRQSSILTDQPNLCGLPNLPGFLDHRHDQSVLSLMAIRDGIEVFRHPSQFGNHAKLEPYRERGEWTRHPYGTNSIYYNSPYNTLLYHHRGSIPGVSSCRKRWRLRNPKSTRPGPSRSY
jgi:hypothetical protein